jgi:hypothetical protein
LDLIKKVGLFTITFLVVFGIYSILNWNHTYTATTNENGATITLTKEEKLLNVNVNVNEKKIVITDLGLT